MKRDGRLLIFFIVCLTLFTVSIFADEQTVNLESRIVEDFDNPEKNAWLLQGSKFSSQIKTDQGTDSYPKLAFVNSWPEALYKKQPEGKELKALGIHGKFDRKGYNFIEVIPVTKGSDGKFTSRGVSLPGRVQNIDMWVWGSNFDYYMEAHIMDFRGMVHVLPMGGIRYIGWKNLRVNIPPYIPQSVQYAPHRKGLELVKLVMWTKPNEKVDDFYMYIDQIKIFTDLFETRFDGEALADPDSVKDLWSKAEKK